MYLIFCLSNENDTVKDYDPILVVKGAKERTSDVQLIPFKCPPGSLTLLSSHVRIYYASVFVTNKL